MIPSNRVSMTSAIQHVSRVPLNSPKKIHSDFRRDNEVDRPRLQKTNGIKKEEKLSIFLKAMLSSFKPNYCIRFKSKAERGVAKTWEMITLAGFIP